MLIKIVSSARFQAIASSKSPAVEYVDGDGYCYINDESGDYAIVFAPDSNLMTQEELAAVRKRVVEASGDPAMVSAITGMKVNSPTLTSHPVQITGVASYGSDYIAVQMRVNLFQVLQTDQFIHPTSGNYRYANFSIRVPKTLVGDDGKRYETNAYTGIDTWFKAAKEAGCTETNGDVVVAIEEEQGKWTFTGHSNQYITLDEFSQINFELAENEDGSLVEATYQIDNRSVRGYKTLRHKAMGDFSINPVAGGRVETPVGLSAKAEKLSNLIDSIGMPAAQQAAPPTQPVTTDSLDSTELPNRRKLPRPGRG